MGLSEGTSTTTTASSSSNNNAGGGAGPAGQEMRGWALVSRGDKVLRAAKKQLRIKRDAKKKAMKKNAKLEKKNSSSSSLQQMVDLPAKGGAVSIAALPPPKMGHSGGRRARGSGGQDRRAPAGSSHSDKSSSSSSSALDKNCAHWRFAVLDPMNDCIVFYKMEDLDDADNEVVQTFLLSDKKLAFVQVDEEVPADAQGPGAAAVSTATSAAAGGTRRKKAVVAPFHVVVRQKNSARVQLSFKTRAARDAWFRAIRDAHKISTGDSSLGDLVGQWQGEAQVCDDLKCFLPSSLPAEILDEESDDEDDDLSDDDSAEDSTSSDEVTGADAGEGAGDGGMRLRRGSSASSGLDRSLQRRTSMTQLAGSKTSSKKNEGKVVSRDELLSVSLEDSKRRRVEMSDIISAHGA